jgi:hypothetical protein
MKVAQEPVGFAAKRLQNLAQVSVGFYREAVTGVRLRVRIDSGVKVPIGQKHWSVRS